MILRSTERVHGRALGWRTIGSAVLVAGCVCSCARSETAAPSTGVRRVVIQGELDRGSQSQLNRALDQAAANAEVLIVELNTPGGEIELMWQMAGMLLKASDRGVKTVAFVNDTAASAGALLAMACEVLYMRPHATIGSAVPVRIGIDGLLPVAEDPEVREKLTSNLRAEFRAVAKERRRPEVLAEAMVDPDVEVVRLRVDGAEGLYSDLEYDDLRSRGIQPEFLGTVVAAGDVLSLTGTEAVELGLADGLADSLEEVVSKLGLGPRETVTVARTRSEDLATLLITVTPLLVIAGFVLLYLELKTPGFGVAGTLALLCFGAVFFGRWLVGLADVPHLVLLVVGAGLLATELFLLPGTVWMGAVGVVCLVAGLLWSFGGGLATGIDRAILIGETRRFVGSALVAMLVIWGLSRFLPKTPVLGRLVLAPKGRATASAMPEAGGRHAEIARVGALGRALTALRPVGKVVLDGDRTIDYEGRASGPEIPPGERIRVIEVEPSGRLLVEADAPERPAPPSPS